MLPDATELTDREYWAAVAITVFAFYMVLYVITPTTRLIDYDTVFAMMRATFFGIFVGWLFVQERYRIG
ncbi:MAG: hypothetical protein ACOCT0_02200 [Halobacteriota archaeon]